MEVLIAVLFYVDLLIGTAAAYYAFKFTWRYRNVRWQTSPWGKHIMFFSFIVGCLFLFTVLLAVAGMAFDVHPLVGLILSFIGYSAAAWQLRKRVYLEDMEQGKVR